MTTPKRQKLPLLPPRHFAALGECIYCGRTEKLTKEHIIPFALGGSWVLPDASCKACAKITGAFEGEFSRTILGPLRMLYDMPTRRPKDRPRHIPLKVKYENSTDWEIAYVDRRICPFLILMPLYDMPDLLTGDVTTEGRSAATRRFWIRGGGFWSDRDAHLQWLCEALGAKQVMPTGTVPTEPFCLTIAKIAHSFAIAEMGRRSFSPFLSDMIMKRDMNNRAAYIGGGAGNDEPSKNLHDVTFVFSGDPSIVVVAVRLFALLGTPTYHVVVGSRNQH